jgi:hypothetical protein
VTIDDFLVPAFSRSRSHPRHDPPSPRFQTAPIQVGPGLDRVVLDSQTTLVQVDQGSVRWGTPNSDRSLAGHPKRRLVNPSLFLTPPLSYRTL